MQLLDPKLLGFQPLAIARDRFQLAFVRAVMMVANGRLVVKGGMAIRAELDGVRMTEAVWSSWCADEAASHIRRGAIVSLQKVLGDAGVLNNFTSWVTCVVALPPEKKEGERNAFGFAQPSTGNLETQVGLFRFQAMPSTLVYQAGALDDCLKTLPYQRATPEKAFFDWLYLGSTPRSHMTLSPLDLDFERLNQARIARLAKGMGLADALHQWKTAKRAYEQSPGSRANAPG